MKEELLKGLSEEQIARIKACKTTEEMFAVAKEEGVELTDEQLEAISGGACTTTPTSTSKCPFCGSINYKKEYNNPAKCSFYQVIYTCNDCGKCFNIKNVKY